VVPADQLPVEPGGQRIARSRDRIGERISSADRRPLVSGCRCEVDVEQEGVEVGRRFVPEGYRSLICECEVHVHMVASGPRRSHRASQRLAVRPALLQILADEPEKDTVDPLAVSPVGLTLHSLVHEAHALRMTDRTLVEAVALELHPVVVEFE